MFAKTNLYIEHKSKQSFIDIIQYVLDNIILENVYFSSQELLPSGRVCILPHVCLDITLSGSKHMIYSYKGKLHDIMLKPGDIHYSPPKCWKRPVWDSPHEMSSLVFHPDYLRVTYINIDNPVPEHVSIGADSFYHTSRPLCKNGKATLQIFNHMAESGNRTGAASLMKFLLEITLEELIKGDQHEHSKAHDTWLRICQYLRDNCQAPINRAYVARVFQLNPSYVSRLFASEGEAFNAMLRRLRLEHATMLLTKTNMNIDEVTESCGYLSSTFFISTFKRQYGVTPGEYRRTEV